MLGIDLTGKRAFIAGIGDDRGFAWAIAKALAEAGAELIIGVWPPVLQIFETSLQRGKFDESRRLNDGRMMEFKGILPLDVTFDTMDAVPSDVRENKRYKEHHEYSVAGIAEQVKREFGPIDLLVHSVANAPEVKKPLLETSRNGYLAAMGASAYSLISLLTYFGPMMNEGGACISLTFVASQRTIPGYGGGMSSAKAALESDTRTLAWEAGEKWGVRVNTISAGAWESRASKAIGFIDAICRYQAINAPLKRSFSAEDVAHAAAFLLSPLAAGMTGTTIYVDNGMHTMGLAVDSCSLKS